VATTDLPMTPMVAEHNGTMVTAGAAAPTSEVATAYALSAKRAAHRRATPRPSVYAYAQSMYRPDYRRPPVPPQISFQSSFGGQALFGGRW
jgi:hypothetical protein